MRLPNANRARVDPDKIEKYLLSHDHPDGASKARFFELFGFQQALWETFANTVRRIRSEKRWQPVTGSGTF